MGSFKHDYELTICWIRSEVFMERFEYWVSVRKSCASDPVLATPEIQIELYEPDNVKSSQLSVYQG